MYTSILTKWGNCVSRSSGAIHGINSLKGTNFPMDSPSAVRQNRLINYSGRELLIAWSTITYSVNLWLAIGGEQHRVRGHKAVNSLLNSV